MKNDLTCGVVRDLLPSYVEGLTSPESNTAVERHLSECPECAQLRTALAGAPEQAAPEDAKEVDYLKKVKRRGWRRVAAAVAVTVLLFAVGVAAKLFLIGTPIQTQGMSRDNWTFRCTPSGPARPAASGKRSRSRRGSSASPAVRYCPLPSVIPVITGPSSTRRASTRSIWEIN